MWAMGRGVVSIVAAGVVSVSSGLAAAATLPACDPSVGELVAAEGVVQVQRAGTWQPAGVGTALCERDTVRTEANSRAAVSLVNDAVFRLDQNTAVHLADIAPKPEEKSFVELVVGAIQSFSRKPRELEVNTPYLNATIEGTEFVIRVAGNETQLTVFEGRVRAANDAGEAAVNGGEMVVAQAGRAPERRVVVRPRDAAQWSIYYPPLLAAVGGATPPAGLPAAVSEALSLAGRGNASGALEVLAGVPEAQRDARYHLYSAAIMLAAGQATQAGTAVDAALRMDQGYALAHAQRAVIEISQNRNAEGLESARHAVTLAPESGAAHIALSYALQAAFRLEDAVRTMQDAITAQPEDALARARLAELWLMLGRRDRASAEAGEAVRLQPNLARTQMVLGFAALTEIRTDEAKAAFRRAIELDSDDPLPHLGLGLATIRGGDLAGGRQQIEVAVGLDPEDPLLRSYLGKAYFEEKRDGIDAQQLEIARSLDPNDPTPYLYDALRKLAGNQPVDALLDLDTSIALNDDRAVYRGRLQLDEDRAARGASLARVYSDLGFLQLGLAEATRSLTDDPSNAAAHRFLSDTYAGLRRREISRVSEQLQAQMLQDININPVSPSLSETNVVAGGAGGPASAGLNEYTALFERNAVQFSGSGLFGMDETSAGEGIVSLVHEGLSLSVGKYEYGTDGFRPNNDARHEVENVYAQMALAPELNVQFEYRHRDSEYGDLPSDFDPALYMPYWRRYLDQEIGRFGMRYSPTPNSDFLLSYVHSNRDVETDDVLALLGPGCFLPNPSDPSCPLWFTDSIGDTGDQVEVQGIVRGGAVSLTAGMASNSIDRNEVWRQIIYTTSGPFVGALLALPGEEITHEHGYIYGYATFPRSVTWTLGVAFDNFEHSLQDVQEVSPKFGVQWDVTKDLHLRGGAGQVVKPALVNNRTLEPTQVAGVNQFYDDQNGTVSQFYGVGLDWAVTDAISIGAEGGWRNVDVPFFVYAGLPPPVALETEQRKEQTHRAYAYWTPSANWAMTAEFVYDRSKMEDGVLTSIGWPLDVETMSAPLGIRHFQPGGFFAGVTGTWVRQSVDRVAGPPTSFGEDSFFVVDAGLGWRLPGRSGVISLEGQNLLDQSFSYQDDHYREFGDEPSVTPYAHARTIMGRVSVNF